MIDSRWWTDKSRFTIAFVIPVFQKALVGTINIQVLSRQDQRVTSSITGQHFTPGIMAPIHDNPVMNNIISTTIDGKLTDKQPFS